MKKSELNELVRMITRHVLREFQNIDPTSNSSIHDSSNTTNPQKKAADSNDEPDLSDKTDQKHDIEQQMKSTEQDRKTKEADYKRNQQMVTKYRNYDKPAIKKQQDALKQQLRSI